MECEEWFPDLFAEPNATNPWITGLTPLQKSLFCSSCMTSTDSSLPAAYLEHEADAEHCCRAMRLHKERVRTAPVPAPECPKVLGLHDKLLHALERCL